MNKKFISSLILAGIMSSTQLAFGASNYSYKPTMTQPVTNSGYVQQPMQYPQNNTLKGSVIMVPAGATIPAMLTTQISSEYTTLGQTVTMALNNDFYYDNRLVAPAGSTIQGNVIEVSKAKHGSINGKLCVRFNQIITPYGTTIPITAVIKTDDSSGVLVGGTKMDVAKDYAKDLTVGSAAGALSGLVFGALAGGNVGRGAALGTAVGAGSGLVKSIADKGEDVEIPAYSAVDIMLLQPITVSPAYYNEN